MLCYLRVIPICALFLKIRLVYFLFLAFFSPVLAYMLAECADKFIVSAFVFDRHPWYSQRSRLYPPSSTLLTSLLFLSLFRAIFIPRDFIFVSPNRKAMQWAWDRGADRTIPWVADSGRGERTLDTRTSRTLLFQGAKYLSYYFHFRHSTRFGFWLFSFHKRLFSSRSYFMTSL